MIHKIPSLAHLIKVLQQVPYLASKNLYRVATYFLTADQKRVEQLCAALLLARENIITCPTCHVWQEKKGSCVFCSDPLREGSVVCVVETWQELIAIEKTEGYKGMYHVLGGAISPLEGVGPEDLTIESLCKRVARGGIKELILATNQTPEGEATASYIAKKVKDFDGTISCLARGVPVGSTLEFMDKVTVYKALSERRPF